MTHFSRKLVLLGIVSAVTLLGMEGSGVAASRDWSATLLVGVPHPITLAGDYRFDNSNMSAGLALGGLSLSVPDSSNKSTTYKFSISGIDGRFRWHPWQGAFFLGTMLGVQSLTGQADTAIIVGTTPVPTTVKVAINTPYLTPHLGWFWVFDSGFTLGFELGAQIPIHSSSTVSVTINDPSLQSLFDLATTTQQYQDLQKKVTDLSNQIGQTTFPYFSVLRIGWSF